MKIDNQTRVFFLKSRENLKNKQKFQFSDDKAKHRQQNFMPISWE